MKRCLFLWLGCFFLNNLLYAQHLDPTFGVNGIAYVPIKSVNSKCYAFVLDPAGNSYLAGNIVSKSGKQNAVVSKLDAQGKLDPTFGTNGTLYLDSSVYSLYCADIAWDKMGHLLLSVVYGNNVNERFLTVEKITTSGAYVTDFGTSGMVDASYGFSDYRIVQSESGTIFTGNGQKIDVSGKTVKGINAYHAGINVYKNSRLFTGYNNRISNTDTNGTSISNFADNGSLTLANGSISTMLVNNSGSLFVAENTSSSTNDTCNLYKITSAGKLVLSFGNNGQKAILFPQGKATVLSSLLLNDKEMVLAGYSSLTNTGSFILAKLDTNGMYVPSFGSNGQIVINVGDGNAAVPYDMEVDTKGNLFIAGIAYQGGNSIMTLAKLTQDFTTELTQLLDNETSISIFPNPAKDAHFLVRANEGDVLNVKLVTLDGREESYSTSDVYTQLKGILLVKVITTKGTFVRKIDVQ